jgi:hypothetical protein
VNYTQGNYHKEVTFTKIYTKFVIRNNYQVPAKVTGYIFAPKVDTNTTPQTAFENGLADVGGPSATAINVYPTDSILLKDLWKISASNKRTLEPGQEMVLTYTSTKPFQYDPHFVDTHASAYQRGHEAHSCAVRVVGTLGHDTAADEQGLAAAGVDYMICTTYELKYNGGGDVHTVESFVSGGTFTNGAVLSEAPIADNQAYSVT